MDNIIFTLYETLSNLEMQCRKKEFLKNKSRSNYELQIFIRMELWQKEEVRKQLSITVVSLYSVKSHVTVRLLFAQMLCNVLLLFQCVVFPQ